MHFVTGIIIFALIIYGLIKIIMPYKSIFGGIICILIGIALCAIPTAHSIMLGIVLILLGIVNIKFRRVNNEK